MSATVHFVDAGGGGIGLVERMFIFFFRMCPLAVSMDLGRCLRTRSEVRPGHETKKPASMA